MGASRERILEDRASLVGVRLGLGPAPGPPLDVAEQVAMTWSGSINIRPWRTSASYSRRSTSRARSSSPAHSSRAPTETAGVICHGAARGRSSDAGKLGDTELDRHDDRGHAS